MRKIYMARRVSLIVIWPSFENKMAIISHVKWDYPIRKGLTSPLSLLTFTCDPFFSVKWGYLTTKALYFL